MDAQEYRLSDLGNQKFEIRRFCRDEFKKDTALYALVYALNIESLDIKDPSLIKLITEKAGKKVDDLKEYKQFLISNIKNPENDEFFRRKGLNIIYPKYLNNHDLDYQTHLGRQGLDDQNNYSGYSERQR